MTTTYRFVGDSPELFADLRTTRERTPVGMRYNAETGRDEPVPFEEGLLPGEEVEGPDGLHHARLERRKGDEWVPTLNPDEPAPEPPGPPPLPEKADELAAFVDTDDGAARLDEIEAAERARTQPRKTVLEAVEAARARS